MCYNPPYGNHNKGYSYPSSYHQDILFSNLSDQQKEELLKGLSALLGKRTLPVDRIAEELKVFLKMEKPLTKYAGEELAKLGAARGLFVIEEREVFSTTGYKTFTKAISLNPDVCTFTPVCPTTRDNE